MKNVLLVTEPGTRSGEIVDMLENVGYVVHQAAEMRDPGPTMMQMHAQVAQTGRPVLVVLDHGAVAAKGGDPVLFAGAAVQTLSPAVVVLTFRDLVRQAVIEWAEYGSGDYDPATINSFYTAARARRGRVNRALPKPDLALQDETLDRGWVPHVRALAKATGADLRVVNMPRPKEVADWVSQSVELFRATQGRPVQAVAPNTRNKRAVRGRVEGQLVVPMGGGGARTTGSSLHKLDASSVPMGGITNQLPAGHVENLNFSTAARRMGGDGLLSSDGTRQTHSLAFGAAAQRLGGSGLKVGSRDQQGQVLSVNAAMGQRQRPRKGRPRQQQKPQPQPANLPVRPGSPPRPVAHKGPRRPVEAQPQAQVAPALPVQPMAPQVAPQVYMPAAAAPNQNPQRPGTSSPMTVYYPENHPNHPANPANQMPQPQAPAAPAGFQPMDSAPPPAVTLQVAERVTDAAVSEEALSLLRDTCGAGVLRGSLLDVGGRLAPSAQAVLQVPVMSYSLANFMANPPTRQDVVFCLGGEIVNGGQDYMPERVAAALAAVGRVVVVALPTGPGNVVSGPSAVATLKRWFGGAPDASTSLKAGADQVRVALWQFADQEEPANDAGDDAGVADDGPETTEAADEGPAAESAAPKKKKAASKKKAATRK